MERLINKGFVSDWVLVVQENFQNKNHASLISLTIGVTHVSNNSYDF